MIVPKGLPFSMVNQALKKKEISRLINQSFRRCGLKDTVIFADQLMYTGFRLATRGGISIAIDDMLIPSAKEGILAEASREVKEIEEQYPSGLVTPGRTLQQSDRHLGQGRRQGRQGDDGATGNRNRDQP